MALHDKLRRQKAIQDSTERRAARVLTKRARELLAQLTRLCPVCLEDCPITSLTNLADCGHKVCTPCASAFVDAELLAGKAYVRCPWAGCDRLLGKAALRQFGSAAAWDAYESSCLAMHTQRCATRGTRHYYPAPRTTRRRERSRLRRLVDETDRGFLLFCADQARRCPSCMVVIWRWAGCLARETAPHTLAARRYTLDLCNYRAAAPFWSQLLVSARTCYLAAALSPDQVRPHDLPLRLLLQLERGRRQDRAAT